MSFVSYAQNYEDVMLWRVLKEVSGGFYIDVGANDPEVDSITKAFYDRGWAGINIEPLSGHYSDLLERRPRDINLECAAGSEEGEFEIWEGSIRGWATMDRAVVDHHLRNGYSGTWKKVSVRPLRSICADHVRGDVHFLKVDVEGAEAAVLSGMDFERVRPWIVVVEAIFPNSVDENYSEWEYMLLSSGYAFVYADGVNRFYVANERPELRGAFRYPPNILDEFITRDYKVASEQLRAEEQRCEELERKAEMLEAVAKTQAGRADDAEHQAADMQRVLMSMQSSISWRITRPLRWASRMMSTWVRSSD
ncbi:FkbM family methyltransferase [Paraburkholderia sp. MPAMCS5]|uniref:FkbM family methyltransferase n=1 Tax=Paraburkholderia sp. MPAMCS5 TaxID=3112563 RepID=UPI002E1836BA|nr:FkbM family methyltransferase [Paraburkholderia sp. MPAMCS5]